MQSTWEENEHEAARLALAKMSEELPEDYAATSTFLGIPFRRLSRAELYVVIKYSGDMGNLNMDVIRMSQRLESAKAKLIKRIDKPWWRFWS